MANKKIGIIAEDHSDVDVLVTMIQKIAEDGITPHSFVGHGCGRLQGKCRAWSENLRQRGCTLLIILHDSDDHKPQELKNAITSALGVPPIENYAIVIPVRMIEA